MIHPWGESYAAERRVQVEFRTARLKRCYEQMAAGTRRWGETVARRYVQRVSVLFAADGPEDLYRIPPLHFHALTGNREGQFAMVLHDRWRLILSFPEGTPRRVRVEEATKHYGD